jgi:hypothetical protein
VTEARRICGNRERRDLLRSFAQRRGLQNLPDEQGNDNRENCLGLIYRRFVAFAGDIVQPGAHKSGFEKFSEKMFCQR